MAEPLKAVRLTHPSLDFWVDLRVRRLGASWLAVADLAGEPVPVAAAHADIAIYLALLPLGPAIADALAEDAMRRIAGDGWRR